MKLPMPAVEQQKRGESLFAEMDGLQRIQVETAAELDALLRAVLDRAFPMRAGNRNLNLSPT